MLQKVPFIIWGKDFENHEINTIIDTADIVSTLLNMFVMVYNPNYYSGTDAFSDNHERYMYFSKEIFYDGNIFYDGLKM